MEFIFLPNESKVFVRNQQKTHYHSSMKQFLLTCLVLIACGLSPLWSQHRHSLSFGNDIAYYRGYFGYTRPVNPYVGYSRLLAEGKYALDVGVQVSRLGPYGGNMPRKEANGSKLYGERMSAAVEVGAARVFMKGKSTFRFGVMSVGRLRCEDWYWIHPSIYDPPFNFCGHFIRYPLFDLGAGLYARYDYRLTSRWGLGVEAKGALFQKTRTIRYEDELYAAPHQFSAGLRLIYAFK